MKTTIRTGSFETNSSSTHALVMMNEDEYRSWKHGDIIYNNDFGAFVTRAEAAEHFAPFVHLDEDTGRWFEANDPDEWTHAAVAKSLNEEGIGDSDYYGVCVEDEGELNGVHAVAFETSTDC